jgi:hypothetical protein
MLLESKKRNVTILRWKRPRAYIFTNDETLHIPQA